MTYFAHTGRDGLTIFEDHTGPLASLTGLMEDLLRKIEDLLRKVKYFIRKLHLPGQEA